MKQDMILILDLGSEENPRLAREVRAMGVYTEIHPHDLSQQALSALPNVKGIILNGGENRIVDGQAVEVRPEIYELGYPMISVDYPQSGCEVRLEALPEREALEKIKAMVAELGPQSYLATAFEGCFEDAEQNIEDDAAYSMKARLEIQAQRAIDRGHEVDRLKADLAAAQSKVENLQSQFDFASQHIKKLERQQLPEQLRRDLWVMVTDEAEASRARMAEAAEKMAVGADNPGCVLFKDAVTLYRAEKARAEAMEQRAAELDALEVKTEN